MPFFALPTLNHPIAHVKNAFNFNVIQRAGAKTNIVGVEISRMACWRDVKRRPATAGCGVGDFRNRKCARVDHCGGHTLARFLQYWLLNRRPGTCLGERRFRMTTHLNCSEFAFGHGANGHLVTPYLVQSQRIGSLALPVSGVTPVPLPSPIIPLSCTGRPEVATGRQPPLSTFHGVVQTNSATNSPAVVCEGSSPPLNGGATVPMYWTVNGVFASNDLVFPLSASNDSGVSRNAPLWIFTFTGDALAAVRGGQDDVPEQIFGTIQWAYPEQHRYMGLAHFCEFEERPDNSDTDATQFLNRIKREIQWSSAQVNLGPDVTGADIVVNACSYTALAPDAAVMIAPSDFGPGAGQIPTDVLDNSAVAFRAHPSVFLRRQRYVRSVDRRYSDANAIDTGAIRMPIRIHSVTSAPLFSNWLIIVDGVPMLVQLDHGGADLRRPRDIWNQLWVPLITGNTSVAQAPIVNEISSTTTFGGGSNLMGPGSYQLRLGFLEYARCLPITTGSDLTQTNSQPN